MNVELLRKVQKFLLEEPRRFDMGSWIENLQSADVLKSPPCGTACCIAGAAYILDTGVEPQNAPRDNSKIKERATLALQLSEYQTAILYFTGFWPPKFELAYEKAKTPLQRAKVGVARIEHFIKTKGAE